MRDRRGAEQAPPHQRQAIRPRLDRHHGVALAQIADRCLRKLAVRYMHEPRPAEADIIEHPDVQIGQPGERRDMLEMPHRDHVKKPVLGLAVEHHGPAPRLDAKLRYLLHDTLRIVLRLFQTWAGAVRTLPIVTATPSPPP